MEKLNFVDILRNGCFYDLEVGKDNCKTVINKLGEYEDMSVNNKYFYDLYWGDVCVSFYKKDDIVFYIQIQLSKGVSYGKYLISDYYDPIEFHSEMSLESLFLFLNHTEIQYKVKNPLPMNTDVLIISVGDLNLYYHLEENSFLKFK